jgi:hypothetical protein
MALTGFVDAEGLRGLRMVTCATAACSTACSSFANERTSSPIPGEGVYQSWARSTTIASRVGLRGQGMASMVKVNAQTYSTIGGSPGRL